MKILAKVIVYPLLALSCVINTVHASALSNKRLSESRELVVSRHHAFEDELIPLEQHDLYGVLDLDITRRDHISLSEIQKAYKQKAQQWHPDRNPGKRGTEMAQITRTFQAIEAAYKVLSDPKKRELYNAYCSNPQDFKIIVQGQTRLPNNFYHFLDVLKKTEEEQASARRVHDIETRFIALYNPQTLRTIVKDNNGRTYLQAYYDEAPERFCELFIAAAQSPLIPVQIFLNTLFPILINVPYGGKTLLYQATEDGNATAMVYIMQVAGVDIQQESQSDTGQLETPFGCFIRKIDDFELKRSSEQIKVLFESFLALDPRASDVQALRAKNLHTDYQLDIGLSNLMQNCILAGLGGIVTVLVVKEAWAKRKAKNGEL